MQENDKSWKSTPTKIIGASVGHILEWYDFGLYGIFAIFIADTIFTGATKTSLLYTFLVFGLGFVFRPLGSVVFAHIGDRIGRKNALLLTFWFMGIGTIMTGLIPSYASIGYLAPLLLVFFRIVQGFGAGGEWGGVGTYLTELGGSNRRGFFASWQQVVILLSILAGTGTGIAVTSLNSAFIASVGWRIPFVVSGGVLIPVAALLRSRLPETDAFETIEKKHETVKYPIVKAFTKDIKSTVLVMMGTMVWTVSFYIMLSYFPTYIKETTTLNLHNGYIITSIGIAVLTVFVPIFAYISDKIKSRKKIALIGSIAFIILPYPVFTVVHGGNLMDVILATVVMDFFIAFLSGTLLAWFAESFPTNDRYTGFVPYNISTSYLGGFAPFIATALIAATNDPISPTFYLILAGIVSTIGFLLLYDTGKLEQLSENESVNSASYAAEKSAQK